MRYAIAPYLARREKMRSGETNFVVAEAPDSTAFQSGYYRKFIMLKTLKAIYDPKQGLTFSEPVNLQQPVNVLVTILEPCRLADVPGHADKKAAEQPSLTDLLAMPEADKVDFEPLPLSGKLFHPADLS